jgi:transcriptional regulator with XRE-family HTH domain
MRPQPDQELIAALGQRVREARTFFEMTQAEVAQGAGLNMTYIGQVERGERNVGFTNVVRIARGLGITTAELLRGIEH